MQRWYDAAYHRHIVTMDQETKKCQNCKAPFVIEPDDFAFYQKIDVPPPTFCPLCRKQRRLSWRNDMKFYSRTCSSCAKSLVSLYAPGTPMPVYCNKCWWGDSWDPKSYGREYDFSKPFFEQYRALRDAVPVLALVNDDGIGSVNCEYTHDFAQGKDCYMVFITWKVENCMYSWYVVSNKEVVDAAMSLDGCEYTYETVFVEKCYRCRYVSYSVSCVNCAFCFDCRGCTDCFLSTGLRNKQYCVLNEQHTKEEYEKILAGYRLDTFSGVMRAQADFRTVFHASPRKFANFRNSVNCIGDYLFNCKNLRDCFSVQRGENCRWDENSDTPKDSYDLSVGGELEQCYEGITPDHSYRGRFAIFSWKNTDVAYVDGCHSSRNLFGCTGLKNADYCILNKEYSKEEYEALIPRIKAHMDEMPYVDRKGREYRYGEFFPSELSYFGYNDTVAQDEAPLSETEARALGFNWQENPQMTTGKETVRPDDLPDAIGDVTDSITKEVLACTACRRNYRIVPQELAFYRRMGIPLPRKCFFCRHDDRLKQRNPLKLWHRQCMCEKGSHAHQGRCPVEFETSYSPDRPETVYCEGCYNAEVV
jgi:hypothetical protein